MSESAVEDTNVVQLTIDKPVSFDWLGESRFMVVRLQMSNQIVDDFLTNAIDYKLGDSASDLSDMIEMLLWRKDVFEDDINVEKMLALYRKLYRAKHAG